MKTNLLKITVVSSVILFSSSIIAQGLSFKSLNTCKNDFASILNFENETPSVEELPPGVYLARSVTQSLEKSDEKYYTYQTLVEGTKVPAQLCYKGAPTSSLKTQAYIPTVIDQTSTYKLGHTFWSLSAVLDKLTGAVHTKRSLIPKDDYRKALTSQGYQVASFQKTHKEFQLRLVRDIASWKETIVITYDQF